MPPKKFISKKPPTELTLKVFFIILQSLIGPAVDGEMFARPGTNLIPKAEPSHLVPGNALV
jgi:hypothetical protein